MTDPIHDTVQEDSMIVETGPAPRIGLEKSRKQQQQEAFLIKQDRERDELNTVLNTEAGQAVIMRLINQCHIYSESMLDDAAQGQRILGVRLVKQICALSPDSWPNMLLAHAKRQKLIADADVARDDIDAKKTSGT